MLAHVRRRLETALAAATAAFVEVLAADVLHACTCVDEDAITSSLHIGAVAFAPREEPTWRDADKPKQKVNVPASSLRHLLARAEKGGGDG